MNNEEITWRIDFNDFTMSDNNALEVNDLEQGLDNRRLVIRWQ
jgi:hypothetical protein